MSTSPLKLQVLIVTHRPDGISRVAAMDLPKLDGVGYVISWQAHENAPVPATLAQREDVIISRFGRTGVSANRNNALDAATAPVVLIGDDDLEYNPEALLEVISIFEADPTLDFAAFRYSGGDNKPYPTESVPLNPVPKGFHLTAFEAAIRRGPRTARLRFREDFGPGAPRFIAAEDDMLLVSVIQMGLNARFFPLTIATHPELTTGYRPITDSRVAQAIGAVLRATHTAGGWIPRIPLTAWRLSRSKRMKFLSALKHLTIGALIYKDTSK